MLTFFGNSCMTAMILNRAKIKKYYEEYDAES